MKSHTIKLLTIISQLTGFIFLIIIGGGIISRFFPQFFSFYSINIEYLFWFFWIISAIFLILLILYYIYQIREQRRQEYLKGNNIKSSIKPAYSWIGLSGGWILVMLIPAFLAVMESYILIKISLLIWLLIILLSLLAIASQILSHIEPENRALRIYFSFFLALGIIFPIFIAFLQSNNLERHLLKGTGTIDKYAFAGVAAKEGNNFCSVLEEEIGDTFIRNGIQNPKTADLSYLVVLDNYIYRLGVGKLEKGICPGKIVLQDKTFNALFIERMIDSLGNEVLTKPGKQKVIETFLKYLVCISMPSKTGEIEVNRINDMDHDWPIAPPLLNKLIYHIKMAGLSNDREIRNLLISIYNNLCAHTTVNINALETFLGRQEVEPCQR